MVILVLAGLALLAELPPAAVAVVVVAAVEPWLFLAAATGWAVRNWRRRRRLRPGPEDEARFLEGLAAELAAGASLRLALVEGAARSPRLDLAMAARMARTGRPTIEVGAAVRRALAVNGAMAAAAFRIASSTGAATARLFSDLAARARQQTELARERTALTAQARLSAWVVGGAPLLLVFGSLVFGGGLDLLARPFGALILVVGLGLEGAGLLVVWWMLRRAAL